MPMSTYYGIAKLLESLKACACALTHIFETTMIIITTGHRGITIQ